MNRELNITSKEDLEKLLKNEGMENIEKLTGMLYPAIEHTKRKAYHSGYEQGRFDVVAEGMETRPLHEIKNYITELEEGIEKVRENKENYRDEQVPLDLIKENEHRITTLEWVLGEHERFD